METLKLKSKKKNFSILEQKEISALLLYQLLIKFNKKL